MLRTKPRFLLPQITVAALLALPLLSQAAPDYTVERLSLFIYDGINVYEDRRIGNPGTTLPAGLTASFVPSVNGNGEHTWLWTFKNTNPTALNNLRVTGLADVDISAADNTFFNEYGQALAWIFPPDSIAPDKWEISEPGYHHGDLLMRATTGALTNTSNQDATSADDAATALSVNIGTLDPGQEFTVTATLTQSGSNGLQQQDLADGSRHTFQLYAKKMLHGPGGTHLSDYNIVKIAHDATVEVGTAAGYTLHLNNLGPDNGTGITLTDNIPSDLTNVTWICTASGSAVCGSASGSGNALSLAAQIPVGDSLRVDITGTASAVGTLTNTAGIALIDNNTTDPNIGNNTSSAHITVTGNGGGSTSAELSLSKTTSTPAVQIGDLVQYQISVHNAGPDAVTGAQITDNVPAALQNISWTCSASGGANCASISGAGNAITAGADIPSGGNITLQIKGIAQASGTHSNMAEVTASVNDPDTSNNTDTADITVSDKKQYADLTVDYVDPVALHTDQQSLVLSGDIGVTVSNIGAVDVPAGVSLIAFRDDNHNGQYDSGTDTLLGTLTTPDALQISQTHTYTFPVSGTLDFRDAPVYVLIDSDNKIEESNKDNNLSSTAMAARIQPDIGEIEPELKWAWNKGKKVASAIVVIPTQDDNGDGVIDAKDTPSVIFISYASATGTIHVLDGKDGSERLSITGNFSPWPGFAAGDIDNDGKIEIVVPTTNGQVVAVDATTGHQKWISAIPSSPYNSNTYGGGPSLADLNGDGQIEILFGRHVLRGSDGTLLWAGAGTFHGAKTGMQSFAADINLDGFQEVIVGASAYDHLGNLLWQNSTVGDGFSAVGNFNDDPYPEIVVSAESKAYLLNHLGEIIWGPVALPGGGRGGAPVIADMDGDGIPEIGIAGAKYYTTFKADGSIFWSKPIQDTSSSQTGSSVFDFNGDGRAEVVYADETKLHIYDGATGDELFTIDHNSGTGGEYPVIADVDNDAHADLVLIEEYGAHQGIRVFQGKNNSWVRTRNIWNQYDYHINNISDDLTIPAQQGNSWELHNTFRLNRPLDLDPTVVADLTASYIRVDNTLGNEDATLTVRIGNGGGFGVPAGVWIAFYNGDPDAGGTLIGTAQTTLPLESDQYEDITLINVGINDIDILYIVADDDGTGVHAIDDANWNNNTAWLDITALHQGAGGYGLSQTTLITTGASLENGDVYVWGFRGSAQQGNGKMVVASNEAPAKVGTLSNVKTLTGGAYHLIALDGNGDVYGWGQSGYGETGCAPTKSIYVETPCKVLKNGVQVAAGEYFSIALDKDGQVWTWGHNLYGQLGTGVKGTKYNTRTPQAVNLRGEKARLIGAAYEGAFAVTEEGHVWAWGDNEASGLGYQGSNYGVQRIEPTPTRVPNLDKYAKDITYIAGGNGWGEALLKDGTVIGWGLHAALGQGTTKTNISSPQPVTVLKNVKQLFARYVGSFALTTSGDLYTWGQTGGSAFKMIYGETPTLHKPIGTITAIGGGKEHLFYKNDAGKVFGIGYNDLHKIDQSKCCAPTINWPGKEITIQ